MLTLTFQISIIDVQRKYALRTRATRSRILRSRINVTIPYDPSIRLYEIHFLQCEFCGFEFPHACTFTLSRMCAHAVWYCNTGVDRLFTLPCAYYIIRNRTDPVRLALHVRVAIFNKQTTVFCGFTTFIPGTWTHPLLCSGPVWIKGQGQGFTNGECPVSQWNRCDRLRCPSTYGLLAPTPPPPPPSTPFCV